MGLQLRQTNTVGFGLFVDSRHGPQTWTITNVIVYNAYCITSASLDCGWEPLLAAAHFSSPPHASCPSIDSHRQKAKSNECNIALKEQKYEHGVLCE